MRTVVRVRVEPYDAKEFGLFGSKRRRARIYFQPTTTSTRRVRDPERAYRSLLPIVYERMTKSPYSPTPMPEKLRAEWRDDEGAFKIFAPGFNGFFVTVSVRSTADPKPVEDYGPSDEDVEAQNGSSLPRIAT